MKQKTAVNWLETEVKKKVNGINNNTDMTLLLVEVFLLFDQAESIFKEQIISARANAPFLPTPDKEVYLIEAEEYFKETYGTDTP